MEPWERVEAMWAGTAEAITDSVCLCAILITLMVCLTGMVRERIRKT